MTVKAGDKVVFGRRQGEKTLGTVIRVSRSSVTVHQDESRGALKAHPVGSIWRVHPSFVEKVESSSRSAPRPAPKKLAAARRESPKSVKVPIKLSLEIGSKVMKASPVSGSPRTYDVSLGRHVLRVSPVENALDALSEALHVLSSSADTYDAVRGEKDPLRMDFARRYPIPEQYRETTFVRDMMKWAHEHTEEIAEQLAEVDGVLEELELNL